VLIRWEGESGFVTRALLEKCLPERPETFQYMIGGPEPLMDIAERSLRELAIPLWTKRDVGASSGGSGDLALVQWASIAQSDQLLEKGVRIVASPAPFDRSKALSVNNIYTWPRGRMA
jgi:hypothetical protein